MLGLFLENEGKILVSFGNLVDEVNGGWRLQGRKCVGIKGKKGRCGRTIHPVGLE